MDLKKTRYGLLGGSFDPVHLAHIELARAALQHLELDGVTLIPAGRPWQRGSLGASPTQRLEMLQLAVQDIPGLMVSSLEIEREGPTYTIDTLRQLPSGKTYFWILGADQLENFCTWHEWQEIARRVALAVAARPGTRLETPSALKALLEAQGKTLHVIPMPPMDLSATEIRRRLAAGENVDGMLPPAVAQYIQRYGLYRHPAA